MRRNSLASARAREGLLHCGREFFVHPVWLVAAATHEFLFHVSVRRSGAPLALTLFMARSAVYGGRPEFLFLFLDP